jgi:hypothetical protein
MKTALALALFAIVAAAPAAAQSTQTEEAAVRAALDHYLQGHATGSGDEFSKVFHPESMLFWVTPEGAFSRRTSADYIKGAAGKPAADEAQRKRRILMVDVDGTAAVAKVELDYPGMRFIDYFTLLKVDGQWKIMNKIFHRYPPRSSKN